MSIKSKIRDQLQQGKATIGSWMQIPHASVAELMGKQGYDWIAIDMEHGSFSLHQLPDLCRAIEIGGTLPFVRVAQNHSKDIKQALDAGAKGIIVPMVESRKDAENAVSWSLYPPQGGRGVGYSRANDFGINFTSYNETINEDLVIIAQIEHIKAVNDIEQILSVERLDGIITGPYDLSASMGLTGQFQHPDFLGALNKLHDAAKKYKIPMGLHIVQPDEEEVRKKIQEGYQIIAYGTDAIFLYSHALCPKINS